MMVPSPPPPPAQGRLLFKGGVTLPLPLPKRTHGTHAADVNSPPRTPWGGGEPKTKNNGPINTFGVRHLIAFGEGTLQKL